MTEKKVATHCSLPSCDKELTHTEGRRKKKYCDAACKMKHWAERNKNYVPKRKHIKREEWEEIQKKLSVVDIIQTVKLSNLKEELNKVVLDESTLVELAKSHPKTLDQLKSMCPPELKGIDRTEWIAIEREKHGI